jgi:hypothetical protein
LSIWLLVAGLVLLIIAAIAGISDNIPAITAMLVGLLAVVMGVIFRMRKSGDRSLSRQILYWTPRALCMVFAGFISIFALDVFSESKGIGETLLALVMHLIPTILIVAMLIVSWRREWVGGIVFFALAILYVATAWRRFPLSTYFLIAGPLVLMSVLFFWNWIARDVLRPKSDSDQASPSTVG